MRASGILLPISSLPSKGGIGCFSKEAYDFVDFLVESKQKYWQILPIVPTSYGDSPYASSAGFAGNPYFVAPDMLIADGLLTREEFESFDFGADFDASDDAVDAPQKYIDYGKLYDNRAKMLRIAYDRSNCSSDEGFIEYCGKNAYWLDDYAIFDALKSIYPMECTKWDEKLFRRDAEALADFAANNQKEIEFRKFVQYIFDRQWSKLKAYANSKGIDIIGDLPIYVAMDSVDFWSNPDLFMVDENGIPVEVAGCPPDAFTEKGQLWGNPLYAWDKHKAEGYSWWEKRIRRCMQLYDVIRIDHFRGFDEFYCIPNGRPDAVIGQWRKGPGIDMFDTLNARIEGLRIIAEDLGYMTDSVIELLRASGYPGMKVVEFAFDPSGQSEHMPHNFTRHCVVYTGTHDNQTVKGWYATMSSHERDFADVYLGRAYNSNEPINLSLIRMAMSSIADTCIIPIQDYLGLGDEARVNAPSTLGNNWVWRCKPQYLSRELSDRISLFTRAYGRLGSFGG